MKLTLVDGGPCPDKVTCPAVYTTDNDTVVVQGYLITDPDTLTQMALGEGETAVEIPKHLWCGRS